MTDLDERFVEGLVPKIRRPTAPIAARVQPVATADDRRAIGSLLSALDPFFQIRGTMPAQYIKAFLLVAFEEGLSLSEYAERAGVSLSVMSRHLQDIGDRNRYKEEGFGLVTSRTNPLELRRHEFSLTPRGRALLHNIMRNWERS
jgi:DNA-binding MarR family transcriptional regulator